MIKLLNLIIFPIGLRQKEADVVTYNALDKRAARGHLTKHVTRLGLLVVRSDGDCTSFPRRHSRAEAHDAPVDSEIPMVMDAPASGAITFRTLPFSSTCEARAVERALVTPC